MPEIVRHYNPKPTPCDVYQCINREVCRKEGLACIAYKDYVIYPHRKMKQPSEPSKEIANVANNESDSTNT